jgi:hypothetical protein
MKHLMKLFLLSSAVSATVSCNNSTTTKDLTQSNDSDSVKSKYTDSVTNIIIPAIKLAERKTNEKKDSNVARATYHAVMDSAIETHKDIVKMGKTGTQYTFDSRDSTYFSRDTNRIYILKNGNAVDSLILKSPAFNYTR